MDKFKLLSIFCLIGFLSIIPQASGLAVMSVDLGSEFMKIAIVKPGVPMEIALNSESRRKTPVAVSFRNGERLFGDAAVGMGVRFPKNTYQFIQDLLGKDINNVAVTRFKERFPYYNIEADPETNMVVFRHDDETTYSVEELFGMVLEHAKEIASNYAEQTVNDAVITVPAYFNQAERRAVARAAELAGIKVLQLMNDNTAVALQFGIFRRKEFNGTAQHYMFYDMGSTSTSVTVVAYQEVKQKNTVTSIVDKFPQVHVKGVGFDHQLGGLEFTLRLRDHLAKEFNAQKKTSLNVFENPRAMAKLFKEANRVKAVLSANTDFYAQVEGLLDDQDFKVKVSRAQLEELCADLFERVELVVKEALDSSEVTMNEITEVTLMGGATRMPKIQEMLQKVTGREELGKKVNTDEAAALGAVYQAAHLSQGFKVKKFNVKEANIFPIQVQFPKAMYHEETDSDTIEFERVKTDEDGTETTKMVKRTLFGRNNPYPQKKVMTFNKHTTDFTFYVSYGDMEFLNEHEIKQFGELKVQEITLSGIETAHKENAEGSDPKGVKAHFKMDESGILVLDVVESIFERSPEQVAIDEESTLSKMGKTFSNFFGSSSDESETVEEPKEGASEGSEEPHQQQEQEPSKEEDKTAENKDTEQEIKPESTDTKEEAKRKEGEKEGEGKQEGEGKETKDEEGKQEEKKEPAKEESTKEESTGEEEKAKTESEDKTKSESKSNTTETEEKKEKVLKPKTVKAEIKSETVFIDKKSPTEDALKASKQKIKDLKAKDEEKLKLEKTKNELETFIVNSQDKLWQEEYEACSTDAEREELRTKFSETSDWLYETDDTTERKAYEDKLKELKKTTKKLFRRVDEYKDRPKALEALKSMLNYSNHFLAGMKNFTGETPGGQPFTQVEYNTLDKIINETKAWRKTSIKAQDALPATETPTLLVEDIAKKIAELEREVKYLVNKAKIFKPKPPKKEKKDNATESSNTTKDATEEKPEGIKIDILEQPGEEEKPKKRKEKKVEETGGDEKLLELDGAGGEETVTPETPEKLKVEETVTPETPEKQKDPEPVDIPTESKGHDPDDEL